MAFTLWECCVSLCVMATAFGTVNWQWSNRESHSLKKETDRLHAKLQETRVLAAMQRVNGRLLLHADPRDPELAWRQCVVQKQDEEDPEKWITVGEVHELKAEHRVVPPKLEAGAMSTEEWSSGISPTSSNSSETPWKEGTLCYAVEFKPTGRILNTTYLIVVQREEPVSGKRTCRGLRVNSYGQISQIGSHDDHETVP